MFFLLTKSIYIYYVYVDVYMPLCSPITLPANIPRWASPPVPSPTTTQLTLLRNAPGIS